MAIVGSTAAVLLLGWYLAATVYLVFRDEMLARLMSQQTEMQYAYEDRLAALRNQIDKVTSRQLLDQNSLEGKLHELLSRQAQLETRQAVVASLHEQPSVAAGRPAIRPAASPSDAAAPSAFAPNLPAATDAFEPRKPGSRDPRAIGGPDLPMELRRLDKSEIGGAPELALAAAIEAADRLERRQIATLESLEQAARRTAQRLSAAFAETGLDAQRFTAAAKQPAQGGPLVPLGGKGLGPFETKLHLARLSIQQAEVMRRIVGGLPLARPMPHEFEITSGFGARSDPFTRGLAMHTGVDFRASAGTPVRATAAGKVIEAGYAGGYGNMVEIDHGNGLTTRYAHMSSIGVDVGDTVAKGDVLGRVGSTGRSTGPHLHYETRIDGEAADPLRFIRAGQRMASN
jgi:murein DD-endopeptidase MepM/ murein hydrolase activator NlpD